MPLRPLLGLAAFVLAATALLFWASDWLTLDWLKSHRDDLIAICEHRPVLAVLAYLSVFMAWGALCLPGAGLLALLAGVLFGRVAGTLVVTLAATGGATLGFLVARHWLHDWVHQRFRRVFAIVDRGLARDGAFYVFMTRLIVVIPYFLVNPLLGLTDMRLRTFVWSSAVGLLANSFLWVNAGTMLNRIERMEDVLSLPVLLSLSAVGVLPLALKWLFFRDK